MIRRMALCTMIGLTLAAAPAKAQTTAVDDSGNIVISGEITFISRDSFTITQGDGADTQVMFSSMNEDNIEKLRESNVLRTGSRVTVEGELGEGPFNNTVIEADNIYVQAPQNLDD